MSEKTMISDTLVGMTLTGRERRQPCLVQFSGQDLGRPHFVNAGDSVVGRDPRAEIFINEPKLSRQQCQITFDKKSCSIIDLRSANGTYVNRIKVGIQPVALNDGDTVILGNTTFKFFAPGNVEQLFYDKVYREKTIDQKTKVFNDKYLISHLRTEIMSSLSLQRDLCIIIYDLDHFKMVNDTYGHVFGDEVLKITAQIVAEVIRKNDALCRYGGEEFVVILPQTDLATAARLAERIRKATSLHVFKLKKKGRLLKHIQTMSLGVVQLNGKIATPEKMIKAADRLLYNAKKSGRNRVCY